MIVASVALALLAVALAWPVPVALARAGWTRRAPGAALVLWQSIALAGALSMIGALLTWGLAPFGDSLLGGAIGFIRTLAGDRAVSGLDVGHVLALAGALLLGGHLLLNLTLTAVRTERQRLRHRRLVGVLSEPLLDRPGTRLLDTPAPVAFCLPGAVRSVTVLSAGLVDLLGDDELRAVVEHERAHVEQRHYLLLLAFHAWHASLPWFPIATLADREVGVLVEMLADDRARRSVDDRVLATAIALVAGMPQPPEERLAGAGAGLGEQWVLRQAPQATAQRVRRLLAPPSPVRVPARFAVLAASIGLLAVPAGLLLGPTVGVA